MQISERPRVSRAASFVDTVPVSGETDSNISQCKLRRFTMFRLWKTTLPEAGSDTSRRGKRRFVPSLTGSASCLEDRVVLNGGGQFSSVDEAAQALANTRAGQTVTNMFQSILMTNPTNAQMVQNV